MSSEGSRIHSIDYRSQFFYSSAVKNLFSFHPSFITENVFTIFLSNKKVLDQSQDDLVN